MKVSGSYLKSVVRSLVIPSVAVLGSAFVFPVSQDNAKSTAEIQGKIADAEGAPVVAALVSARHLSSGLSNDTESDPDGHFVFAKLAPGRYEVTVSHPDLSLQSAQTLTLAPGGVVTVSFDMVENSVSTPARNRITENQLTGLPMNGRSYSQLATLQAGVSDPTSAGGARGIGGGGLTVAGGRSTSNVFLLDGTNIMDLQNRVPRSAGGVQLGSDSVMQVQVFSSSYGAEYGRGSGGVLNSITRSGTPEWHGSFFEFFRNSALDARNFFDPGEKPTPFKRNQFGASVTGPIWKRRTFLSVSFEAMRDRLSQTEVSVYPDEQAREGVITDINGVPVGEPIPVAESVKPYLELYPVPNGERLGGGTAEHRESLFFPTDEDFISFRMDHLISDKDSFFLRYTLDDALSVGAGNSPLFLNQDESRQQYLTFLESHTFSPDFLNAFRFSFTRPGTERIIKDLVDVPSSLSFVPEVDDFGVISIPGVTDFGSLSGGTQTRRLQSFQFADDVLARVGAHSLKFGVDLHLYDFEISTRKAAAGEWFFNSLDSFLQAGPEGTQLVVALPGSDSQRDYTQTFLAFYLQDSFRLAPRLDLNLGLRYEWASVIEEINGKSSYLDDVLTGSEAQVGPLLVENPSGDLAPRIGLSWAPWEDRDTVLRAGFGLYYDQLHQYLFDRVKNNLPFYSVAVRNNFDASSTFPNAVVAAQGVALRMQTLDRRTTENPMVLRYSFDLEHRLGSDWRFRAAYVGARGNHLFRFYEANLFPSPVQLADGSLCFPPDLAVVPDSPTCPGVPSAEAGPINPAFGSINLTASDAQSFYNSLRVSAGKRVGSGPSLQASYTFSKSVDDSSTNAPFVTSTQYGLVRTLERGLSDFDARHRLTLNYFYDLPFGKGRNWGLSPIVRGWRLGGIFRFRTGTPFTPRVNIKSEGFLFSPNRPNLIPGREINATSGESSGCGSVAAGSPLGTRELYFDPCVFEAPPPGTIGDAGRNSIIGPSLFNWDTSLSREFQVSDRFQFQFRLEVFNVTNRTNFESNSGSSVTIFSGSGFNRNSRAGRLNRTSTTSRQIQIALRVSF